jgi:protein-L-isoaspartate(D-aspartate) O-methyltransferase
MTVPKVARDVRFMPEYSCAGLIKSLEIKGIRDPDVLAAIGSVPRHRFIDSALFNSSCDDIPLPIGYQQTISQPFIVALMSEKLIAGSLERRTVLEIGTGCGYQTAILACLYGSVYSIERIKPLFNRARDTLTELRIANVELRHSDGYDGWKGRAVFDSILLTAAPEFLPQGLLMQLAPGGCLVAPVGKSTYQRLRVICDRNGVWHEEEGEMVRFVPLVRGISE